MQIDLVLAIFHHLAAFALAGVLAAELVLLRPGFAARNLKILSRLDGAYGALAVVIVAIGVSRVMFGLKGWEYYVYYWAFWAKMTAFVVVGLLSVSPTIRIARWRRAASASPDYTVPDAELRAVRPWLRAEAAIFALILVFAAVMARGIGY